jgi:hypothetical protein
MDLAKGEAPRNPGEDFAKDGRLSEIPHPADLPEATAGGRAVVERKPLGLLADMQLLVGRWEDVLSTDEIGEVDTLITDAPYSARTHAGGREGERGDGYSDDGLAPELHALGRRDHHGVRRGVVPARARLDGRAVRPPPDRRVVARLRADGPLRVRAGAVRHQRDDGAARGDGPSSWSVYAMVARPTLAVEVGHAARRVHRAREPGAKNGRGKPRWLMDALVRDYSRGRPRVRSARRLRRDAVSRRCCSAVARSAPRSTPLL